MGEKHVAYSSKSDEWLIASKNVQPPKPYQIASPTNELKKLFNEVEISNLDDVRW